VKLIQVGGGGKGEIKKKCFNGCNYFSEPGIHDVTKTRFWHVKGWLSLYC